MIDGPWPVKRSDLPGEPLDRTPASTVLLLRSRSLLRSLTDRSAGSRVGPVPRALAVLTCGALLTLLAEATALPYPLAAVAP
jgi:hypothetical protein